MGVKERGRGALASRSQTSLYLCKFFCAKNSQVYGMPRLKARALRLQCFDLFEQPGFRGQEFGHNGDSDLLGRICANGQADGRVDSRKFCRRNAPGF